MPDTTTRPGSASVALVTGATSGIGEGIARQLLETGLTVHVAGRDAGRLEATMTRFATFGAAAIPLLLDVTDAESIARAAEAVETLDVLVNNAGANLGSEQPAATALDLLRRTYEINVFGVVAVTAALLPALLRSRHARVVNISSGTGSLTWSGSDNPQFDWRAAQGRGAAYRSSKTALNALTLFTAQSLEAEGVKVNALAPGLRNTRLAGGITRGGDPAEAAAGAVRLALLPDDGPTGGFFTWDGTPIPW
jgi:NAD(P)-dependent dehydrogenase (short-subunit alcohol dehydrogenase family)